MKPEERRGQILAAARAVFVRRGYKGSTTLEIAKQAGISEVTLFRHFDSKKALFMACILPVLTETLQQTLGEDHPDGVARLREVLKDRLTLVSENRDILKLILMENQVNEELRNVDFIAMMGEALGETLEAVFPKKSSQVFMHRLVMGSLLSYLYLPEGGAVDVFLEQFMQMAQRVKEEQHNGE